MEKVLQEFFLAFFWAPIPFKQYQNTSGFDMGQFFPDPYEHSGWNIRGWTYLTMQQIPI